MATYAAYFDASGSPSATHSLFVSGYVSTDKKWSAFEREWLRVLRAEGIRPPFHMKDFAFGTGQYEPWRDDDARRMRVLRELVGVIKQHVHKSISTGVVVADFDRVARDYDLKGTYLYPYSLCAVESILKVERWRRRTRRQQAGIHFIFESGDLHQGKLIQRMRDLGGPSPEFQDKRAGPGSTPLQACDLIAWQHARALRDASTRTMVTDPVGSPRDELNATVRLFGCFIELQEQIPRDWGFFEESKLRAFCQSHSLPRRN